MLTKRKKIRKSLKLRKIFEHIHRGYLSMSRDVQLQLNTFLEHPVYQSSDLSLSNIVVKRVIQSVPKVPIALFAEGAGCTECQ